MKLLLRALTILLALAWLPAASCGNPPVNPTPGVGGTSQGGATAGIGGSSVAIGGSSWLPVSKCALACANLLALGCPEDQSSCERLCLLHATDSRFSQGLDCRIDAKTKAEAQKCGPASCKE